MAWGKIAQRLTLLGGLSQSVGCTVQLYIFSGIWTWPETLSPDRNRVIQVALQNIVDSRDMSAVDCMTTSWPYSFLNEDYRCLKLQGSCFIQAPLGSFPQEYLCVGGGGGECEMGGMQLKYEGCMQSGCRVALSVLPCKPIALGVQDSKGFQSCPLWAVPSYLGYT